MDKETVRGNIVHRCRDSFGDMLVADDEGKRSLYFGNGILQSSILLDSPGTLIEDYH